MGAGATANGTDAVAVGTSTQASVNSIAMGKGAKATGSQSISIGTGNVVSGNNSGAIGDPSTITGNGSYALGNNNTIASDNAFVIGNNVNLAVGTNGAIALGNQSRVSTAGGVALGEGSNASRASGVAGYAPTKALPADKAAISATTATRAAVDVGSRQITSVGAGSADSDAVNVAQLKSVENLASAGWNVADSSGTKANIGPAGKVTFGGDSNVSVTAGGAQDAGTVSVALNKDLNLSSAGSLTIGNSLLNDNGLTITGGPSITGTGIDAGSKQITNVTAGSADTDAVNVKQLKDSTYEGWSVQANGGAGDKIGTGESVNFADGSNTSVAYDAASNKLQVNLNNDLNLGAAGSLTIGNSLLNDNGLTITGGPSITGTGIDAGSKQITNVTAGSADTDAVNVKQLKDSTYEGWSVQANGGAGDKIGTGESVNFADGSNTSVAYDAASNKLQVNLNNDLNLGAAGSLTIGNSLLNDNGLSIAGGPSITGAGIDAGSKQITNVAAGTADSDAVNYGQLKASTYEGWSVQANGGAGDKIGTGESVNFADGSNTSVAYDAASNKLQVNLNNDLNLGAAGSLIIGNSLLNDNGLTIAGGPSITGSGINAGSKQITNVAAGSADTDAVNVSQLQELADISVKYDLNQDGTVNYNNITLGGDTYNSVTQTGGTKITNVARGVADSDAVNMSQLNETNTNVTNLGDTITHIAGDTSTSYTDIHGVGIRYARTNEAGLMASDSSAEGQGSTAVGYNALSVGENSLALGREAMALNANDVALGTGSETAAAVGTSGTTIAGKDYNFAGANPLSTVSVGSIGNERTITNVAAGRLSADSTDAVNGSQLFATNSAINGLGIDIDILDKGSVKYDINQDGTVNYNNITLGGDTYNSVTKSGGTKITNVARGIDDSDAVNMSQLNETNTNVTNLGDTINYIAGDTSTSYTDIHGVGIRYARTNEAGLVASDSSAEGQGSTAVGYNALSVGESSLALGREAKANNANDVALGAGSETAAAVSTSGTTIAGKDYNFAGANPLSTVSVGSVGNERTITNVAAGRLSADSTDAVNGSQLFATNSAINDLNTSVGDLDQSSVKYDRNPDGTINYNNITLGGDTYNSVTKTGGTKITNVARGEADSDAVNMSQLNETNEKVTYIDNRVTTIEGTITSINNGGGIKYFHANSTKADSVASGENSVAVGPDAKASGKGSVAMGDGAAASADGSVALGQGSSDNGRGAESYTGKYSNATNNSVGTISVGNAATGETRTISNVADGKEATDAVNLRQLDGAVAESKNYTDNTVKQINETVTNVDNRVTKVEGDVTNLKNGTDGMFQTNNTSNLPKPKPTGKDSTAGGAGAVASGDNSTALGSNAKATASNSVALGNNSVADRANSVSMGSVGAERQVTNVADGSADTDAVNLRQLNKATGDLSNSINNVYSDLKRDLNKQDDILSAGIAGAMAAAALPQPYSPGASMASVGAGNYRGQQALAVGVSRISDNGKWVTKLAGSTDSQGEFGVSVGVGYQW